MCKAGVFHFPRYTRVATALRGSNISLARLVWRWGWGWGKRECPVPAALQLAELRQSLLLQKELPSGVLYRPGEGEGVTPSIRESASDLIFLEGWYQRYRLRSSNMAATLAVAHALLICRRPHMNTLLDDCTMCAPAATMRACHVVYNRRTMLTSLHVLRLSTDRSCR